MYPLILTIDIGTSSARAMLFDSRAKSVPGCVAQTAYQMQTTRDGGAEFDTNHLFEAVVGTIDTLLAQAGPLVEQIGGVAIDTMVTNIIGFNALGQPATPVFTYADTRSVPDVQKLKAEFGSAGEAEIHNRTGCKVHSTYLPARFLWLAGT